MAPKRTLRERRTVNYNEDALEGARGPSKAKVADLEVEDGDRCEAIICMGAVAFNLVVDLKSCTRIHMGRRMRALTFLLDN
jgi:phosphopantothenate synthetase